MVFLLEIENSKTEMEEILHDIGDFLSIFVDAKGQGEGLALL